MLSNTKLDKFKYFKNLGDELFEGSYDWYDEINYLDYYEHKDDVLDYVSDLSYEDKLALRTYDEDFYVLLMEFYRQIKVERETVEEEPVLNIQ